MRGVHSKCGEKDSKRGETEKSNMSANKIVFFGPKRAFEKLAMVKIETEEPE